MLRIVEKYVIKLDALESNKLRQIGEFTSQKAAETELKSLRKQATMGDRYKLYKITTELLDEG